MMQQYPRTKDGQIEKNRVTYIIHLHTGLHHFVIHHLVRKSVYLVQLHLCTTVTTPATPIRTTAKQLGLLCISRQTFQCKELCNLNQHCIEFRQFRSLSILTAIFQMDLRQPVVKLKSNHHQKNNTQFFLQAVFLSSRPTNSVPTEFHAMANIYIFIHQSWQKITNNEQNK